MRHSSGVSLAIFGAPGPQCALAAQFVTDARERLAEANAAVRAAAGNFPTRPG